MCDLWEDGSYMFYKKEGSVNFVDNNAEHVRAILVAMDALATHFEHFWVESKSGIGSCWGWDLATFDADPDRVLTMSECARHDGEQLLFSSNLVRDPNTFVIESVEGFFVHLTWRVEHYEITDVDMYFFAIDLGPEVGKSTISWAAINNEIYAALTHDLPYLVFPLLILVSYVSLVFYRPGPDSHTALAWGAIVNVYVAALTQPKPDASQKH
jgi:hypothetical protein